MFSELLYFTNSKFLMFIYQQTFTQTFTTKKTYSRHPLEGGQDFAAEEGHRHLLRKDLEAVIVAQAGHHVHRVALVQLQDHADGGRLEGVSRIFSDDASNSIIALSQISTRVVVGIPQRHQMDVKLINASKWSHE